MYRPFAAMVFILNRAVMPTATATAATMSTAEAILTDTGRLANQPGDRPVFFEGATVLMEVLLGRRDDVARGSRRKSSRSIRISRVGTCLLSQFVLSGWMTAISGPLCRQR